MSSAPFAQVDFARPCRPAIDRSFEIRRLARNVRSLIIGHPKTAYLGQDDLVEHLADQQGFASWDLSIHRISVGRDVRTLICVPERISRDPSSRSMLIALKHAATSIGHPAILVHERFIQRQPRLSNCRMVEHATAIRIRAEDKVAILMHLIENGYSTVLECAGVTSHEAPVSVIMCLVAEGVISVPMDCHIGPHTRVDLVDMGAC